MQTLANAALLNRVAANKYDLSGYADYVEDDLAAVGDRALRLEVVARPEQLGQLREQLTNWLSSVGVLDGVGTDVLLAVNEACTNCIEHAYRGAVPGLLSIDAIRRHSYLRVVVSDHGKWQEPVPRLSTSIRGRGIPMMSALSDRVTVKPSLHGTTVTLIYALQTN
ncbi:ATP-binding protein [Mycolicibacterium grossiae]|uniref:ATP-binding protein n=1 Tax=Mycolicibacterium grossiae TaxID=1552759 RepID=UPI0009F300B8|nr:ATP-binding protein [Mycolicibacterium grossiae]QEM43537.1 ATP-binding protein [Mycolicibacterium grossiae]